MPPKLHTGGRSPLSRGPARVPAAPACAWARALRPAPRAPSAVLPRGSRPRPRGKHVPAPPRSLVLQACSAARRPSVPPTLPPTPAGPARKVREPPGPAGQTDNRDEPEARGVRAPCLGGHAVVRAAARPSLRVQCLGASRLREAAAADPGRWGGTCGAARAASRGLGPGLQPRFRRTRGARGPGATAHAAGSRPGAALAGAADPGGVPRARAALPRLRGLSWKPGPEPGRRTPGRTRRGRLPHGQGSKALPPRGHDPRPVSRTRSGGCGWVRGQVFVVSLFPPARGHGAASGSHGRTHTRELSGRTVWTVLSPGCSRAADDVNTLSLQFSLPSPSQRPSWEG